jgi:hypothetical protein
VSPISLLIGGILCLILGLSLKSPSNGIWAKSLALGLFTGLMNFGFFVKGTKKTIDNASEGNGPIKRNVLYFFFRILTFVAIFGMVGYNEFFTENPAFDLIPTAIGYFIHLIVLIIVYLIMHMIDGKKVSK